MTVTCTVLAADWVTLGYTVPVVIGLAGVVAYLAAQTMKGARFHKRTAQEPVLFRGPVLIRRRERGRWSRRYGDTAGSRRIEIVVRARSIEVAYVGRPMGGIGGMQWFFDPEKTTVSIAPGPDGPNDFVPGRGLILEERPQPGGRGVTLALDPGNSYKQVLAALTASGVRV